MRAREGQEEWGQGVGSRVEFAGIAKALAATFATDSKPNQEQTPYTLQTPFHQLSIPIRHSPPPQRLPALMRP